MVLFSSLIEFHLDTVVQGGGDLVDMVQISGQKRVKVYSFAPRDRHALRPVTEVTRYPHRFRMNALGQFDPNPHLSYRRFQPYLIPVINSFCLGHICVDQNVVRAGSLTDLIDPWVLISETTVDIRELVVNRN